jgi:hypothetical protein
LKLQSKYEARIELDKPVKAEVRGRLANNQLNSI